MTQYNTLNAKLSHSRLSKLKLGIKKLYWVNLNLPSNVVYNAIMLLTIFFHKLLLTNTQVSKIHKGLTNCSSANIKV